MGIKELIKDAENQKSVSILRIVQEWYLKRWISYKEYLRLSELLF